MVTCANGYSRLSYTGFVTERAHIDESQFDEMSRIVTAPRQEDYHLYDDYHKAFAKRIGLGQCLSYASARMAFYELLMTQSLAPSDEVLMLGFTCSVMANAVIRAGATPVFYDLDLDTFGSSVENIKQRVTSKTKVIVCQHSFGIPCEAIEIQKFCRAHEIFLIEDCSIAFGSKIDDVPVGNFGDAAIFSTDHTKPINTLIGGIVYSNSDEVVNVLRGRWAELKDLSEAFQLSILKQLKSEQSSLYHNFYFLWLISQRLKIFFRLIFRQNGPFLTLDYGSVVTKSSYPYPARLPLALAGLGLEELLRWDETLLLRRKLLDTFIECADRFDIPIPKVYLDARRFIVPLRIVWCDENADLIKRKLRSKINTNSFWFVTPISSATDPLEFYGFDSSKCPNAVFAARSILNMPTNISVDLFKEMLPRFSWNSLSKGKLKSDVA